MFSEEERLNVMETYRKTGFDDAIRHTLNIAKRNQISDISKAGLFAIIGEDELAIETLEKVYETRSHIFSLKFIKEDPLFDNLQSEPRFKALLNKIGLPED